MTQAVKFLHFVTADKTTEVNEWLDTKLSGGYHFSNSAWSDYETTRRKGIEFEIHEDAKAFISKFGGLYTMRTNRTIL